MENITSNNNKKFLKKKISDVTQHHKNYLGTEIPEDYFAKSKASILDKIKSENANSSFLKENKGNVTEHHQKYLGTSIPENYFENSKRSILDKIREESTVEASKKKSKVFYLRPQFRYAVAASLVFILSLTIWLQQANNNSPVINTEAMAFSDDVLVESLLVDDTEIDAFTDATLFEEVVVKAEEKEQKLDDLILNSLIVEDSLLDDYIKDELIETVIL